MASLVADNPFDTQASGSSSGTGIIGGQIQSQAVPESDATSFNPTAGMSIQTATPQTREVNKATDTTQGQLDSILSQDGPLMQRARALAAAQMQQRGLVNSSMGVEAGTTAMLDKAVPIANADANTYSTRAVTNMEATNQGNQFNVAQNNALVGQGLSIASQMKAQKDQQAFTAGQAGLDREQQTTLQANQQDFQKGYLQTQQAFTSAQDDLNRAQQVALTDKSITAQQSLQQAQQNFAAAQDDLNRHQQTSMQQAQIDAQASLQKSQQDFAEIQNKLGFEQQTKLTELQNAFNSAQISKTFAASTASNTSGQINAIMLDPNMTPASKKAAIDNVIAMANQTLQWASTFYNTSIPSMTTPATSTGGG